MASIYFNPEGALINYQPEGPDKAYIANQEVPYISGSQLRQYAATIYSEASFFGLVRQISPSDPLLDMKRETFAIAYTMYNYAMAKSAAFQRAGRVYGLRELLVDSNYTKGISSPAHQEYFGNGGDETRRRMATMAVIKLFTRQTGSDLFRLFKSHYRAKNGFELSNPAHGRIYENVSVISGAQIISTCPAQNPAVAAKREYTFLSTMTAGGTIFFKIHPQAAAQGITW